MTVTKETLGMHGKTKGHAQERLGRSMEQRLVELWRDTENQDLQSRGSDSSTHSCSGQDNSTFCATWAGKKVSLKNRRTLQHHGIPEGHLSAPRLWLNFVTKRSAVSRRPNSC